MPVCLQGFRQEGVELPTLACVQSCQQFGPGLVGVGLDLVKVVQARPVHSDDIAASILRVGATVDMAPGCESFPADRCARPSAQGVSPRVTAWRSHDEYDEQPPRGAEVSWAPSPPAGPRWPPAAGCSAGTVPRRPARTTSPSRRSPPVVCAGPHSRVAWNSPAVPTASVTCGTAVPRPTPTAPGAPGPRRSRCATRAAPGCTSAGQPGPGRGAGGRTGAAPGTGR